ncbi:glycoside hydrolase family 3 protein [Clostridium fungisolvens]|uniref:beta-glucosidase n=1 Tax=Clostridium fungisolvens TaxID=1604897 RepID=A0A6V8SHQ3_9CLOT|nr:glycoside hydrolase family 3 N-terminal domain-containing protein [Clostridium fungisolvens]GFP76122.1 hypothetical protein bsdtw1_02219 [Clostridium fungisolvens]
MRNWRQIDKGDYVIIINESGKNVAYSKNSGIKIIEQDGFAFKNLSKSGKLEKYEDWRLPAKERAKDLASKLSIKQIAGLMLYSGHQAVFSKKDSFSKAFDGTYNGKTFDEADAKITDLTDQQRRFLTDDNLRHVLVTAVDDAKTAALWNNNLQTFVEGVGFGIPVNISSDPRHTTSANAEFNAGAGGDISKWPEPLGLAATFSSEEVSKFGFIASKEYRALGISTALSPQVDIATDPRWMRFSGTLGEDPILARDLAEAYCNGFQTSVGESETEDGWGYESVNAMVKHWPGGGSCESGRDAHFAYGKYAVYPGNNFNDHLIPFTEGAFKLSGKTKKASAVMPYYTISYDIDKKYGENVGNSFSKYIIKDLLREKYDYDGVVCTDWGITKENHIIDGFISGKSWGVEKLSESERHYKVLMAGVDQFGGNNEVLPILEAYEMGVKELGEKYMRERFEKSAVRLLLNIFRTGLFENPYVDPEESDKLVGNAEYMKTGYECQLKSLVMLKNKNQILPIRERKNVYIPKRRLKESIDWFGNIIPERVVEPVNKAIIEKYFNVVEKAEEADFSIVFIESPKTVGYSKKDGYVPISLQYRPYKATSSRKVSLAGGDPLEESNNRSYFGKTNYATNEEDLDIILETKNLMGQKPIVVSINMANPTVLSEFEEKADAIVVDFGVQAQVILDIISGKHSPSGLLPFNMPKNMDTVEEQFEDVPHDMKCYKDELGNEYSFAYGLNFNGVINDERVRKYKRI